MALFIKFDGVDGESQDKEHGKWSNIQQFSWTLHKSGSGATGQSRRRGAMTVGDMNVDKEYDKSTPKLTEAALTGKVFPKVEIHDTATYDGNRSVYLKYELKNVMVISHEVSGQTSGEVKPMERLSLNFEEVKQTYVEYDAKGSKKGNVEMTWKVEEGTK